MARLLLVDDNVDIKRMVVALLGHEHIIEWAENLSAAAEKLKAGVFDLLLLDIDLPDGNGAEFLAQFASKLENQGVDTIFLTGTNTPASRIQGFQLGASDYIAKPFDPLELQVRLATKLKKRNAQIKRNTPQILKAGAVEVDLHRQQAFHVQNGNRILVDLTPVEFRMLTLFLQTPGEIVQRKSILENVWGAGVHVSSRVVDHHICGLRKKIVATGEKIESVYGVGYRFERSASETAGNVIPFKSAA